MEASPVRIYEYFNGSKQGVIPLFQRPYSWEFKDWKTLWEDLMGQYEESERSSHFMGAIVTVPVKSVPVGVTKHLVIDGQQRLTTLSILLAAIRTQAHSRGEKPTAGMIEDLLLNRHYAAPDDLKLVPTQSDRNAYNALIHEKDLSTHGESKVVQAHAFFLKKLQGTDAEDCPICPARLFQALQASLQVVMINLGESDDPYLIFESLNHKGKPLNQADLVRNYVLMRFQHSTSTGGEQETAYTDLWRPMEQALEDHLTNFLRHYVMRRGRNVRVGDIYTACKGEFEKEKTVEDVRLRLDEMKQGALSYARFLRPDEERHLKISERLQGIRELDSTVFYPLLLRIFSKWLSGTVPAETVLRCLDVLESFYVRRLVCNLPTNSLNKKVVELCATLPEDSQQPDTWLQEKLRSEEGSRRWPDDGEFSNALVHFPIYGREIARYVLIGLERAHQHKEPVDTTSATIEHLMPQTLSEEWKETLGEGYSSIHSQWLDTLGNLTLTGYNAELGNAPFAEKKEKLRNTHFELSRMVLGCERWGAEEISKRGGELARLALQRRKR
jgi:uncharacterized protein with ParB-like and HNH nuclease domain